MAPFSLFALASIFSLAIPAIAQGDTSCPANTPFYLYSQGNDAYATNANTNPPTNGRRQLKPGLSINFSASNVSDATEYQFFNNATTGACMITFADAEHNNKLSYRSAIFDPANVPPGYSPILFILRPRAYKNAGSRLFDTSCFMSSTQDLQCTITDPENDAVYNLLGQGPRQNLYITNDTDAQGGPYQVVPVSSLKL